MAKKKSVYLNTDVAEEAEILCGGRQGPPYPTQSIQWLLMPWQCNGPGHQELSY